MATGINLDKQHSDRITHFSQAKNIGRVHKYHWTRRSSMMSVSISITVNKSHSTITTIKILDSHSYRVQSHGIIEGHGKSKSEQVQVHHMIDLYESLRTLNMTNN